MTVEEITKRIEKKAAEIAKLERLYNKYASEDLEEKAIIDRFLETGDRTEYRAYLKEHNMWCGSDAWSKANELHDARITLVKYQKSLESAQDKQATLTEMPEAIIQFRANLIERWDAYDEWKKEEIKKDYNELLNSCMDHKTYRENAMVMRNKWGAGYYEFMYLTSEQIHKANVTAADALVMNLFERTIQITGKITDCKALRTNIDNSGYTIINGLVIGEKGKARVESIGAGGYNIQRYHIRVLVKEVK